MNKDSIRQAWTKKAAQFYTDTVYYIASIESLWSAFNLL